jgi:hypothetical protein
MRKRMVAAYKERTSWWHAPWLPWIYQAEFERWVDDYEPFLSGRNAPGVLPRGNRGKK